MKLVVHERIGRKHPSISPDDVKAAWDSRLACRVRVDSEPRQYAAIGVDASGRILQMVAVFLPDEEEILVIHAMEATDKMMKELGMKGRWPL